MEIASGPGLLIVDDEGDLVEEMVDYLQDCGCQVISAPDGPAALSALQSAPRGSITVLLTDLRMPGMDGYSLAERVMRETVDAEAIEVMILTGHGMVLRQVEPPAGIFEVIRKPVRLAFLAEHVRKAHDSAMAKRMAARAGQQTQQ